MHIAVIDDGINTNTFAIGALENDVEIKNGMPGIRISEVVSCSHGTICASILKKYAPNCKLSSIRALEGEAPTGNICLLYTSSCVYETGINIVIFIRQIISIIN